MPPVTTLHPIAASIPGIERIPGIRISLNDGGLSGEGVNCKFDNGWRVTIRGNPTATSLITFVSHNGGIRPIESLITCRDMRINDEKRFLNREEILNLLNVVSCLDSSGRVPPRT